MVILLKIYENYYIVVFKNLRTAIAALTTLNEQAVSSLTPQVLTVLACD
jgi:hypothetical protein